MQKWEYMSIRIDWDEWVVIDGKKYEKEWHFEYNGKKYVGYDRDRVMNEMGLNGWELTGVSPAGMLPSVNRLGYTLFFKRPVP